MTLQPIQREDKEGNIVQNDLEAITDGVIAQKAHELDIEVQSQRLQIMTNEFLQGVLVADNKDIDTKIDDATQIAETVLIEKETGRDARLEKIKGTLTQAMTDARVETLKDQMQAWEQDYAAHQAHILLNENADQVASSQVAMLVIEAAHQIALDEISSPGYLETNISATLTSVKDRVDLRVDGISLDAEVLGESEVVKPG